MKIILKAASQRVSSQVSMGISLINLPPRKHFTTSRLAGPNLQAAAREDEVARATAVWGGAERGLRGPDVRAGVTRRTSRRGTGHPRILLRAVPRRRRPPPPAEASASAVEAAVTAEVAAEAEAAIVEEVA